MENNRWRRLTKRRLYEIDIDDQNAFNKWLASIKSSKHSKQADLPSSQIPSKVSLLKANMAQLFVVIDTCSLVAHRAQFIDYVTRLKKLHPENSSPIRFIISLVVLEELDKCNRPNKKRAKGGADETRIDHDSGRSLNININNNNNHYGSNIFFNNVNQINPTTSTNTNHGNHGQTIKSDHNSDLINLVMSQRQNNQSHLASAGKTSDPPRMFMRFIEEEMRTSEILVSELDPYKNSELGKTGHGLEIINMDDRILECCLRSQSFIKSHAHHEETKVLLVTQDNVFKAKATTFGVVSYRWHEFETKYKNFGLNNYVSTPMIVSNGGGSSGSSIGGGRNISQVHRYVDPYWSFLNETDRVVTDARIQLNAIRRAKGLSERVSPAQDETPADAPPTPPNDDDIEIVKEIISLK